jgi:hypothetical protein
MRVLERFGLVDFPPEFVRVLQYGRVVDTTRLHLDLGFHPQSTTMQTVADHGRQRRARGVLDADAPYRYEAELEEFLRSRGRRDEPAARAKGIGTSRRRTTALASDRKARGSKSAAAHPAKPAGRRRPTTTTTPRAPAASAAPRRGARRRSATAGPDTPA